MHAKSLIRQLDYMVIICFLVSALLLNLGFFLFRRTVPVISGYIGEISFDIIGTFPINTTLLHVL